MAAADNIIAGGDMVLYVKDPAIENDTYKMVSCQTDFSIDKTKNTTQSVTKCGTRTSKGETTYEASLSGVLVTSGTAPDGADYIDMFELNQYFEAGKSYTWSLMPKVKAEASNNLPVIEFSAEPSTLNETYPTEGDATFSVTLPLDGAPTYTKYTYVAPPPEG